MTHQVFKRSAIHTTLPACGCGFLSAAVLLTCAVALADTRPSAEVLLQQGRYAAAVELLRERLQAPENQINGADIGLLRQLSQAQNGLGEYRNATNTLTRALEIARDRGDSRASAGILGALGSTALAMGQSDAAARYLQLAETSARESGDDALTAGILNELGNLYQLEGRNQDAIHAYSTGLEMLDPAREPLLAARTLANAARAWQAADDTAESVALLTRAESLATRLPPTHDRNYLLINIARLYATPNQASLRLRAHRILQQVMESSASLDDHRASAFALAHMAELYEVEHRSGEALELIQQGIFHAQLANEQTALYRLEWQRGRILNEQGKPVAALDAYRSAISILQTIRFRPAKGYGVSTSAFHQNIAPIYEQQVEILFNLAANADDEATRDTHLRAARDTVELLKAEKLRNYFRDECVDALQAKLRTIEDAAISAAVIYPIVLKNRLELLISLPGKRIRNKSVNVSAAELEATALELRQLLIKRTTNQYRVPATRLYRWLFEPIHSIIAESGVDTLVFVPDDALGSIPMSALYDGNRFLVEKFAVAITPGVELTDPRPIRKDGIRTVVAGLSEPVQGFPALHHVSREVQNVHSIYGGPLLLNKDFSTAKLKHLLATSEPGIVHLSTHGKFEDDIEKSYILTYDQKLTMQQFSDFIGLFKFRETPLELLVLSACETARGNRNAALGLSGIAVKAGARSALGTLWKVNDAAASILIREFYKQLATPGVSRALALQKAKQSMLSDLRYRHPGYWSAFLLINSWL